MPSERREIYFSGRVQGVGFRYTTRELARRFAVSGYVKNLPDGRVLLVVEGEPGELDGLTAALQAEMDRHITGTDMTREPASGEFTSFEVRH